MRLIAIVLLSVMIIESGVSAQSQSSHNQSVPTENVHKKYDNKAFRYTIVAETSGVQRYVNEGRDYRYIVVLLEDAAFTEANLKTLFFLLSKRYDDRTGLYARIFTSLEAIPTPEEYDRMDLYGPVANYRQYKNAYFSRDSRGNVIRYEIPGKIKLKDIFLGSNDSR